MAKDELEIEIDATGAVKVTTHGVKGKRCLDYQELFRQLLGPVVSSELTPEYVQVVGNVEPQVEVHQRVRSIEF